MNQVYEQLKNNQQKIKELGAMIEIHSAKRIPPTVAGAIQEQRDRLEYQLLELEKLGQEYKIGTMKKVLESLQSVGV